MPDIAKIHALTVALARMTQGETEIHAVAEQYLAGALIPDGHTPASHLVQLRNHLDEFMDDLIEAVWTPHDDVECGVQPTRREQ